MTEKYGATYQLKFNEFHTPTINTKNEADLVLKTAREVSNDENVIEFYCN